jgi:hypothetical protein
VNVLLHKHAADRLMERGATEAEVVATVKEGSRFDAKYGRAGFRLNFPFGRTWKGKYYETKQIEAYAVEEDNDWIVITFVAKYF